VVNAVLIIINNDDVVACLHSIACSAAASSAGMRLTATTTASPSAAWATSVKDAGGSLADLTYWRLPALAAERSPRGTAVIPTHRPRHRRRARRSAGAPEEGLERAESVPPRWSSTRYSMTLWPGGDRARISDQSLCCLQIGLASRSSSAVGLASPRLARVKDLVHIMRARSY